MNNQLTETHAVDGLLGERRSVAMALAAALAEGDIAAVRRLVQPDVILNVPGTHPLSGAHRGVDGLIEFVVASSTSVDGSEQLTPVDFLGGTDHAAVYFTVLATRPGREPLHNRTVHLLRFEAGRVAEIWLHNFDDVAVNEFWS